MQLEDRFYKSTEVADILGVSLRTLYRYMDSEKIESVQLPSGRHRFTKKQIEDFLFKNNFGGTLPSQPNQNISVSGGDTLQNQGGYQQPQQQYNQQPQQQQPVQQSAPAPISQSYGDMSSNDDADLEAELDELLKSLDDEPSTDTGNQQQAQFSDPFTELTASLDNQQPQQQYNQQPQQQQPVQQSAPAPQPAVSAEEREADDLLSELDSFSSSSSILGNDTPQQTSQPQQQQPVQQSAPAPQPAMLDENKINYYYCPYNDLKTVAKMVKKVGDDSGKSYAFTLNAGLSLFFPLDPFSVIHFYVSENDVEYYKDSLQLKETNQGDANVGLLVTRGEAFEGSREVSGLKVVSKQKLIQNLRANGMDNLANEAENKLD